MKRYLKRWFFPLLFALMSVSGLTACESELFSNNGGEEEVRLPESDEYDEVLCSGGGYHIVLKLVDDFDGAYDMVGVVDDKGTGSMSFRRIIRSYKMEECLSEINIFR